MSRLNTIQCLFVTLLIFVLLTFCIYIYLFSEPQWYRGDAPHNSVLHSTQKSEEILVHLDTDPAVESSATMDSAHILTLLTYRRNRIKIPQQFQSLILLREICADEERLEDASTCIDNAALQMKSIFEIGTLMQQSDKSPAAARAMTSILPTEYVAFLDRDTQPKDDKFWTSLLHLLQTRLLTQTANIVGGRVIVLPNMVPAEKRKHALSVEQIATFAWHSPNTIHSAGYTVYFAGKKSVHLQPRYEGLNVEYAPSFVEEWVLSVDRAIVMMHKRLLHHMDYERFGDEYVIHDLCLSQRHVFYYQSLAVFKDTSIQDVSPLNKLPTSTPGSPIRFYFPRFDYSLTPQSDAFYKKWTLALRQHIGNHLKLPYKVVWDYGAGSCSGWFREATDFTTALEGSIPLRIITGIHDKCEGLPASQNVALDRMISHDFDNVNIWISHKPPDRYPRFPYRGMFHIDGIPDYVIGRSMYEASLIPPSWVEPANTLVDEIWVPSKFLLKAFADAGVEPSRLVHIPEPIDIHFFDPRITKPMALPSGTVPVEGGVQQSSQNNLPSCSSPETFKFLSIFKWEKRKGPDILFEAYFKAFKPTDRVCLYVSTYLYMGREPRNKRHINQEILRVARKLGISPENLPRYEILSDVIPTHDMPALYMAADAFVLPTRGEGWGLPIMEAMTMTLPTIASRYGGQLDFMTDDNSYLIDVDMEESDLHSTGWKWWGDSAKEEKVPEWAKPRVEHLVQLMHHVVQNRDEAKLKGKRARTSISQDYSKNRVAAMVIDRIQSIMSHLSTLQKRKK